MKDRMLCLFGAWGLVIMFASPLHALPPWEEQIVERIKPVGQVCLEGESCVQVSLLASTATNAGGGAQENYNKTCATCHAAGIAGAPTFGSQELWEARIAKGMQVLYQSTIDGMPPGMPAKGMCFDCSDDDLKAIVDYMVENAR